MRGYITRVFRNKILIILLCLCTASSYAAELSRLNILDDQKKIIARLNVEVADDDAERDRGLMFRENVPAQTGMLFVFPTPRPVNFWMKNTYVPLDIIFITPDLNISSIHYNARPLDLTPIPSRVPVTAVLEVRAGEAARLGLKKGQKISHPALALP
jgi:uncharacterized membrane protein (UPF0127 family)